MFWWFSLIAICLIESNISDKGLPRVQQNNKQDRDFHLHQYGIFKLKLKPEITHYPIYQVVKPEDEEKYLNEQKERFDLIFALVNHVPSFSVFSALAEFYADLYFATLPGYARTYIYPRDP